MDVFVGSVLKRKSGAVLQVHKGNRPGASREKHSAAPVFPEAAKDGAFSKRQSRKPSPVGVPFLFCLLLVTRCSRGNLSLHKARGMGRCLCPDSPRPVI